MAFRWQQQMDELRPLRRAGRWWTIQNTRAKLSIIGSMALLALLGCVLLGLLLNQALKPRPQPTPTATLPPPSPTSEAAETATATAAPFTATPLPAATATEEPLPPGPRDAQGDVGSYASGAPVEGAPPGIDIWAASIGPERQVLLQPPEGTPAQFLEWVNEGELLLWVRLHEPIPEAPPAYTEWIFALDVDGDPTTGRPVGSARINPDLGMEAALAVYYDPASQFGSYLLLWDRNAGALLASPLQVRYMLNETRSAVGLAISLDALSQAVAAASGVTLDPAAMIGRAAAWSTLPSGERVIDFYPDLPQ
jgi:hypothetical protein